MAATQIDAVSFDCFGTLVAVDRPGDPADAVAAALADRGVDVPGDWATAYAEPHVEASPGAEVPLPGHVRAALESRGVSADAGTVTAAVRAAFDADGRTRDGAARAVAAAAERGPVGVCSNCAVPGLVPSVLDDAAVDTALLDAVVTSADSGWRKPDDRAFAAVADALGVSPGALLHVGDDPAADGGATGVGARTAIIDDVPLATVADRLEADRWE